MSSKRIALTISSIALVMLGAMFVGMGGMLAQTTRDLGVALTESTPEIMIASTGATTEEEAAVMAEKAYAVVEEAFKSGAYEDGTLIAYEAGKAAQSAQYAQPLGESVTVWAGRSQTLASVVAMEVLGIGALAFAVGFIAVRMVKRAAS